jgi:hypothetical protein
MGLNFSFSASSLLCLNVYMLDWFWWTRNAFMCYILTYSTLITHDRSNLLRSSNAWESTAVTWWQDELHWVCVVSFVWRRQNTSNSYRVLVQVNLFSVVDYPKILFPSLAWISVPQSVCYSVSLSMLWHLRFKYVSVCAAIVTWSVVLTVRSSTALFCHIISLFYYFFVELFLPQYF